MKITKSQLKQIIKEEISKALSEGESDIDISTATTRYPTKPGPAPSRYRPVRRHPGPPEWGNPKTLAYFIFDGENFSATMQDGTRSNKGAFKVIPGSNLAELIPDDLRDEQLSVDDIGESSLTISWPDGTKRKYNSATGEEGESERF